MWLRTTDFGDDKDRVLVKSHGELTYFASDTAYYVDKRGARLRPLHLHARCRPPRLRRPAARPSPPARATTPTKTIEVLIGQLVKMYKGGEEVRLSKRAGDLITLEDVVDEVGVDAARYTLVPLPGRLAADPRPRPDGRRRPTTTRSSTSSTRTPGSRRVLRNAADLGSRCRTSTRSTPVLLDHDRENDLLRRPGGVPTRRRHGRRAARAASGGALPRGARGDLPPLLRRLPRAPHGRRAPDGVTTARLVLCAATRQVLANGLGLLGVSAPDRM